MWAGPRSLTSAGENPALPLPGSGGLPAIPGAPWLAAFQSLLLSPPGILPSCVCVGVSAPLFLRKPVILDEGPTLLQYELILTDYVYDAPIFK